MIHEYNKLLYMHNNYYCYMKKLDQFDLKYLNFQKFPKGCVPILKLDDNRFKKKYDGVFWWFMFNYGQVHMIPVEVVEICENHVFLLFEPHELLIKIKKFETLNNYPDEIIILDFR